MTDPVANWCRTALSGQALDRPTSPPDEPEGEEFDGLNEEHVSRCVNGRLVSVISDLMSMHYFGVENVTPNGVRDTIKELHDCMKDVFEENN